MLSNMKFKNKYLLEDAAMRVIDCFDEYDLSNQEYEDIRIPGITATDKGVIVCSYELRRSFGDRDLRSNEARRNHEVISRMGKGTDVCDAISRSVLASPQRATRLPCKGRKILRSKIGGGGKKIISIQLQPLSLLKSGQDTFQNPAPSC